MIGSGIVKQNRKIRSHMTVMDGLAHAREPATGSSWYLFDLLGSGAAVTTPDGALEFCNTALLQLLAQNAESLLGSSIFKLLDGGANNELEKLHRTALMTDNELRTQVRSGRIVAGAVLRRSDSQDGPRVIWSFVDARRNEPAPELALWGTEIGLWDWDVIND